MSKTEEQRDASAFFQKPKFDAFERLICSHLIEAGKSEQPLQTVIHTCLAALTLDEATRQKFEIDKAQIEDLYTVAQRISTSIQTKDDDMVYYSLELHTVSYESAIKPWARLYGYRHYASLNRRQEDKEEEAGKSSEKYFHKSNLRLTPSGFANLVSDFLIYAIPIIQDMSRKLSTLISPETFTELLRVYAGERVSQN